MGTPIDSPNLLRRSFFRLLARPIMPPAARLPPTLLTRPADVRDQGGVSARMPDGQQYEVVDAKLARTAKAFAAYERATPGGSGS